MSKRQHKKSYKERMQGKKKDFLKRAYINREFKLEKTYKSNKKKLKYIISKREYDKNLDLYIIYFDCYDANTNKYLSTYCQPYQVHANMPEVGTVFYENSFDVNAVERNTKATRKYKKILDKANSTRKNKENRKSHEKRHKFREYDYEN